MNRVGELGRGESVWLGWFLYATLKSFAPLARTRGEPRAAGGGCRTQPHCNRRSSARLGR